MRDAKRRPTYKEHGYLPFEKKRISGSYDCSDFNSGKTNFQREMFLTVNFSYSMKPSTSFGITFGIVRRLGFFVSVMSNASFKSFNVNGEFNRDDVEETKPFLKGDNYKKNTRLSLMIGLLFKITQPVALRFGAGYGIDDICYETVDGQWFNDNVNCQKGLDTSLGLQCTLGQIVVSADAVSTDFKKFEAKIGVGYSF